MDDLGKSFDRMQEQIMRIVDIINKEHKAGYDFGTGDLLFPAEIHTIQAIGDNKNINITDLAKALQVTKPTVSERIKKLERIDLIQRKDSAKNMKEVIIELTARGWVVYNGHSETHRKILIHFQKYFGKNTATQIRKCQQAFAAYLEVIKKVKI
jgi:DNA-binding MarR family transcriptional regulator